MMMILTFLKVTIIVIGCGVSDTLNYGSWDIVDAWEFSDGTYDMECGPYDLADELGF